MGVHRRVHDQGSYPFWAACDQENQLADCDQELSLIVLEAQECCGDTLPLPVQCSRRTATGWLERADVRCYSVGGESNSDYAPQSAEPGVLRLRNLNRSLSVVRMTVVSLVKAAV